MALAFLSAPTVPVRAAAPAAAAYVPVSLPSDEDYSDDDKAKKVEAVVKYVQRKAAEDVEAKLVVIERLILDAVYMMPLTLPATMDGRDRWLYNYVMDAYIAVLLHREHLDLRENWRRINLLYTYQQWLFKDVGDGATEDTPEEMAEKARALHPYEMVFFPMYSCEFCHWYVVVVNFARREYQVLDSVGLIMEHDVELRTFRKGVEACMEAASQADPGLPASDMSEWEVRAVEGLPQQADNSSCGLFALKYIELWDGTRLLESFCQEDVEPFRTEVAVQLVFSELNDMPHVKDEVEWLIA